jgi:hypothetical protein
MLHHDVSILDIYDWLTFNNVDDSFFYLSLYSNLSHMTNEKYSFILDGFDVFSIFGFFILYQLGVIFFSHFIFFLIMYWLFGCCNNFFFKSNYYFINQNDFFLFFPYNTTIVNFFK